MHGVLGPKLVGGGCGEVPNSQECMVGIPIIVSLPIKLGMM